MVILTGELKRVGAVFALILAGLAADPLRSQDRQKQVLVLYSTARDADISISGNRELPQILEKGLAQGVDYYSEYIDAGRFPEQGYREAFRDFLRLKYQGQRFDVVIGMLDPSIEFLEAYRTELFTESPIVFFSVRPPDRRIPNSTGVVSEMAFGDTLSLAAALQPDIRQVFVVSGAGERERRYEATAREQFRSFEDRFDITYLTGLPTAALERRLATLPEQSIVLYLLVYEDGAGEKFAPLAYANRLAAVANRPIYSWVDSVLGRGVVGGSMRPIQSEIRTVSDRALEVLRGRAADDIPTTSVDLHVDQVDWRQLRRWGISEARIPAGTVVRFREPSVFERYRPYIVGALALMLAQSALIAGLLIQAARRRRAERQAIRSQQALRESYQQIRDLGRRLLTAQEAERTRIARELHDDVSQQLAVLTIDLQLLCNLQTHPDILTAARGALLRTQDLAKTIPALSHGLHPAQLHLIGLVSAISSLQREVSGAGLSMRFIHDDVPSEVPYEIALSLYRVVQEAIRNAMKHSGAHYVSVHLGCNERELILTIADDGVGFEADAVAGKGLGLISMRERIEPLGGSFEIHSKAGRGTRLEVSVPLGPGRAAGSPAADEDKVAYVRGR